MAIASGPILQKSGSRDNWTDNALAAAKKSDYIVYFGGLDTSAAAETLDRTDISWPTAQIDLITKLSQLNKPLAVVVLGDMLDNSPLLNLKGVNSVLWANWPGQDGGLAVMDLVSGAQAVSGRLPITQYPANYTKLSMLDMSLRPSSTSPGRTYRWYGSAVQPFGFGLHYTTFEPSFAAEKLEYDIQDILSKCSAQFPDTCVAPPLDVVVSNKGNRTSPYVALAFIKGEAGPKPYPRKTLVSYARVRDVKGGEKRAVKLPLTLGSLARVDAMGNTVLYPGEYTVLLDEPTKAEVKLTLKGKETVLDKWPQPPKRTGTGA